VKYNYENITFMALLPCPLRVAFEKTAVRRAKEFSLRCGERVSILPISGMDREVLSDLAALDAASWPEVTLIPGFGLPYANDFKRRYRDKGYFQSIMPQRNPLYEKYEVYDPKGFYDIVGLSNIVFFVDRTRYPELRAPAGWKELLSGSEYRQNVGFVGKESAGFQDNPLLAAYLLAGETGVAELARTAKCCLLAPEMVRMAGSRRDIAPYIAVFSYNMAQAAAKNPATEVVWPIEGAGTVPLTLLTRRDASEKAKALANFLINEETVSVFNMGGFYPSASTAYPAGDTIIWPDWTFLENTDMPALSQKLHQIMDQNANIIRHRRRQECAV
jgi:ABC-type Fe3+ transport system substrate-binding protein